MRNFFKTFLYALTLPVLPLAAAEEPPSVEPVVILGGGIGSMTSAIYLGRAGVSPLIISGPLPGGLLTQSHSVQNWPGELEINGMDLTEKIRRQAEANGARFLNEMVTAVDLSKRPFILTTQSLGSKEKREIAAETLIIAMGSKPNFLLIPGEQDYWGHGVTNCAVCDGSLYRDKVVGVVGGGDAAVLEALYLSSIAKEVHLFVRKDSLRANEEKRVALMEQKPNIKIHFETTVEEVKGGGGKVAGVTLKQKGKTVSFPLDGLFLAIGSKPNTALFRDQLELDESGYILLKHDQETSVEGIYAIGDIADPVYKQAISAAGDGAKAALQAQQYLSDRASQVAVQERKSEAPTAKVEIIDISSAEQLRSELEQSNTPVLIDFYATWCGPCRYLLPLLESSAQQLAGRVKFLKVNVDNVPELTATYDIQAMPTVLKLDSTGNELERKVGVEQISDLLQQLQRLDSQVQTSDEEPGQTLG